LKLASCQARVLIIRDLPMEDRTPPDVSFDPDFGALDPVSLSAVKQRIEAIDINVRFMKES
jgi:ABC-type proline/glycine betaine transport system ATPase subunit